MELINENIYLIRNEKVFSSNTYILKNKTAQTCIVIDPGFDYDAIAAGIELFDLLPIAIISTHGHFDHIGSVSFLKKKFNIPFYLHEADLKICMSANFYLKMAHIDHKIETPVPDHLFSGYVDNISVGEFNLAIFHFPGHSPGSSIIQYNNFLFSGDIIYKNGLGGGSIPRENNVQLKESVLKIFKTFKDDDIILPGHGNSDLLGNIKKNNLELTILLNNNIDA